MIVDGMLIAAFGSKPAAEAVVSTTKTKRKTPPSGTLCLMMSCVHERVLRRRCVDGFCCVADEHLGGKQKKKK